MLDGFSRVILALYRGCREQPVEAFQDWAFEQVKFVLPFDSALWLTSALYPDGSHATIHTRHLHKQPPQLIADWARCQDRTVFTKKVFGSPGVTFRCVTSTDIGLELAEHSRRYSIEHILATTQIDPIASLNELISIYRADLNNPFSEEERLFQQSLVPHLTETWRINRILHLIRSSRSCAAISCAAAADAKGILHLIEPAFTRMLQEKWPGWRGPRLPELLINHLKKGQSRYLASTIVIDFQRSLDMTLLYGRHRMPIDNLSQRQIEIARAVSGGQSHKEIAQSFDLAPSTIRNHISTIYQTLGIGNKAELATLIAKYVRPV